MVQAAGVYATVHIGLTVGRPHLYVYAETVSVHPEMRPKPGKKKAYSIFKKAKVAAQSPQAQKASVR